MCELHSHPWPCPECQKKKEKRDLLAAELLAQKFHETYERLAPEFGYETRGASAVPWDDVPDNNKNLMVAVAQEVLNEV